MATASYHKRDTPLNRGHVVLLAGMVPLFLGTLLSDWAYWSTSEIQWINFASWLNAGALVFAGLALVWALVDLGFGRRPRSGSLPYVLVLGATFLLGFVTALVHGRDAWASMPTALVLSIIVFLLALAALWLGFLGRRGSDQP